MTSCSLVLFLSFHSTSTNYSGGVDFAVPPTALSVELDIFPAVSGAIAAVSNNRAADSHLGAPGINAGTRLQGMVVRPPPDGVQMHTLFERERTWCNSRKGGFHPHKWMYGVMDSIRSYISEVPSSTSGTLTGFTTNKIKKENNI